MEATINLQTSYESKILFLEGLMKPRCFFPGLAADFCQGRTEFVSTRKYYSWNVRYRYQLLRDRLQETPQSTEAMEEMESFVAATEVEMVQLRSQMETSREVWAALQRGQHSIHDEDIDLFWTMCNWQNTLADVSPFDHYCKPGLVESTMTFYQRRQCSLCPVGLNFV